MNFVVIVEPDHSNAEKIKAILETAEKDFSYALAQGESPVLVLPGPGFVYAPAVAGADAGFAYVLINGNAIGKVPVVYGGTVEQNAAEQKGFWRRLLEH